MGVFGDLNDGKPVDDGGGSEEYRLADGSASPPSVDEKVVVGGAVLLSHIDERRRPVRARVGRLLLLAGEPVVAGRPTDRTRRPADTTLSRSSHDAVR